MKSRFILIAFFFAQAITPGSSVASETIPQNIVEEYKALVTNIPKISDSEVAARSYLRAIDALSGKLKEKFKTELKPEEVQKNGLVSVRAKFLLGEINNPIIVSTHDLFIVAKAHYYHGNLSDPYAIVRDQSGLERYNGILSTFSRRREPIEVNIYGFFYGILESVDAIIKKIEGQKPAKHSLEGVNLVLNSWYHMFKYLNTLSSAQYQDQLNIYFFMKPKAFPLPLEQTSASLEEDKPGDNTYVQGAGILKNTQEYIGAYNRLFSLNVPVVRLDYSGAPQETQDVYKQLVFARMARDFRIPVTLKQSEQIIKKIIEG